MPTITTPTLLLDEDICKANIKRMADKAQQQSLRFKPHMKTHQSHLVGQWLSDADVQEITVSSLEMAHYFAGQGWKDITIAFPCNINQAHEINELAQEVTLTLLINNPHTANHIEQKLTQTVNTYIEIDSGSGRTGLVPDNIPAIKELISSINKTEYINWIGFYSHPGHSYSSRSKQEITEVHQAVLKQMEHLRNNLDPEFGPFEICIGDTPCCSVAQEFGPIDAISLGNFVFYDLMQWQIGSCSQQDIAVALACPVVDKYPQRNELVIHGGAIHFSKELLTHNGNNHYGYLAKNVDSHWQIIDQQSYLSKLSQEHGTITCSDNVMKSFDIGDIVSILPVHSCLTANLMKQYQLRDGAIIKMMK